MHIAHIYFTVYKNRGRSTGAWNVFCRVWKIRSRWVSKYQYKLLSCRLYERDAMKANLSPIFMRRRPSLTPKIESLEQRELPSTLYSLPDSMDGGGVQQPFAVYQRADGVETPVTAVADRPYDSTHLQGVRAGMVSALKNIRAETILLSNYDVYIDAGRAVLHPSVDKDVVATWTAPSNGTADLVVFLNHKNRAHNDSIGYRVEKRAATGDITTIAEGTLASFTSKNVTNGVLSVHVNERDSFAVIISHAGQDIEPDAEMDFIQTSFTVNFEPDPVVPTYTPEELEHMAALETVASQASQSYLTLQEWKKQLTARSAFLASIAPNVTGTARSTLDTDVESISASLRYRWIC